MFKFGRSIVLAGLVVILLFGSALAQTVTQETYDRLEMPAIKGIIYGAIDAAAAFQELGKDITLIYDDEWQERWYNAGFLIGWHGDAIAKMDDDGNRLLIEVKQAAKKMLEGYDAIDLGIKQKNDSYIKSGAESVVEAMTSLVTIYGLVEPGSLEEIRLYQNEKIDSNNKTAVAAPTKAPTPAPTKTAVSASVAISGTVGIVNKSANLRSGPGTTYAVVGSAKAGDKVDVVGKNADGSWLELSDDKWIASFLVNQGPSSAKPVATVQPTKVATPATPVTTTTTVAPTATPTAAPVANQAPKVPYWGDTGVQTCGNFEWRVSNVRRAKDTWYYDRKQAAQGEYLIIYVEVKNLGDGDALFWDVNPTMPGKDISERGSQYAAWMMTGGFNTLWSDIDPGKVLTLVGAFDVAPDTHTYLFGALSCEQIVAIGSWFELERGPIKANN